MSHKHAKKTRLFFRELRTLLVTADREGHLIDVPEGSRYIQLSDTLVNQIIKRLDEII